MKLADRMKAYETVAGGTLMRRTPVIVRVDGRCFHTVTRDLAKPFDARLIDTMVAAANEVKENMQGCDLVYCQSDEASFLLRDDRRLESEPWFGNDVQKIASVAASLFTEAFVINRGTKFGLAGAPPRRAWPRTSFDARAFNVPLDDVANYFLWRARDWQRNSLQMFARSVFSHKQLHGKSTTDMHQMLHEAGKNWADLPLRLKNGTWILEDGKRDAETSANYAEIAGLIHPQIAEANGKLP